MQGQEGQSANVISLFESRKKAAEKDQAEVDVKASMTDPENFTDVMKQNAKNKERMEKERLNANKSVLRSYRIKN